jgi:hypothetical protein
MGFVLSVLNFPCPQVQTRPYNRCKWSKTAGTGHGVRRWCKHHRQNRELARTRGVVSFPTNARTKCFSGLPGLIADALPDKFGSQLITEWFAQQGKTESMITPLDRLCYVGRRAMGAEGGRAGGAAHVQGLQVPRPPVGRLIPFPPVFQRPEVEQPHTLAITLWLVPPSIVN